MPDMLRAAMLAREIIQRERLLKDLGDDSVINDSLQAEIQFMKAEIDTILKGDDENGSASSRSKDDPAPAWWEKQIGDTKHNGNVLSFGRKANH